MEQNELETNEKYWDCDCAENYIHLKAKGNYCPTCRVFAESCPDSRTLEVSSLYNETSDNAYFKTEPYDL